MSRAFLSRITIALTAAVTAVTVLVPAFRTAPPAQAAPVSAASPARPAAAWHPAFLRVPPRVQAAAQYVTVRPGDTLSAIAAREYGSAATWPALWWVNRTGVRNPDVISAGQQLALSPWHPVTAWLNSAASRAEGQGIPAAHHASPSYGSSSSSVQVTSYGTVSTAGMGSFQACVIERESGGNSQIWNASGHYGLYQFSYSTWVAHGGAPALFGHASPAYQTEIFWNTVRQDGTSDWGPYDGCL